MSCRRILPAMTTHQTIRAQGRVLAAGELEAIQDLIDEHPDWSRYRLAGSLCERWEWRTPKGVPKTFACRSLLLKLEREHGLRLPPLRLEKRPRRPWSLGRVAAELPTGPALEVRLDAVQPLAWRRASPGTPERARAFGYLRAHHYLGLDRPVGSHLVYLVADRLGRDLAVHLVGAAAWQCAPRDRFIGWDASRRRVHLQRVANHSRFLVLPWVRIPHLASHLLAGLRRRVARDWWECHGHRLVLLETFVESPRYAATAYRADNWQCLGLTQGRTRQEKSHRTVAPPKMVWVHPLRADFRCELASSSNPEVA